MASPLQPPPRAIPLTVKFGLLLGHGQAIPSLIFGTIFLIAIYFLALQPIKQDLQFSQGTTRIQGDLTLVSKITVDYTHSFRRRSNSVPIYACHFNFQVQGQTINGISYTSATQPPLQGVKQVSIEYLPQKPEVARIAQPGYHLTQIDPWAMVSTWFAWPVFFLPLLCYGLWLWAVTKGNQKLQLLKHGKIAKARLLLNEETKWTTKDNQGELAKIHRLIFAYDAGGKMHEIELKTADTQAITDEAKEDVIYLPNHPQKGILIDTLPDWVIREDGTFHSSKPVQNYMEFGVTVASFLAAVLLFLL